MIVNKFKINLSNHKDSELISINIPITADFDTVGKQEIIEKDFVKGEIKKSINPIIDNDRVRFLPINMNGKVIDKIIYDVKLLDTGGNYVNNYKDIGFDDDDIKFRKNTFKYSFLNLTFFDSDNALTQNLINYMTIYSNLNQNDFLPINPLNGMGGQPKPVSDILINMVVKNPIKNPNSFSEGFHIYDYKDGLKVGDFKYIYMRASFNNAKDGRTTNMMVKDTPKTVDLLVNEIYTRIKLMRNETGYFYQIDDTYQGNDVVGPNNISYLDTTCRVNLHQINAI